MVKPEVKPEVLDKLASLREGLEKLVDIGLDVVVERNLKEAIEEVEHGHNLASAMISSRIIRYIIDKIPGGRDEEKIENLVQKGLIPRDRKDEQKQLLTALRLSRNFLSHRIDISPEVEDTLMLLGGAFKLSKILTKLKN